MLTSLCREYYQYFLAQGLLFGFGAGLMYVQARKKLSTDWFWIWFRFYPSIASVSTHFVQYRATAIGLAFSGSSAGGVVFPIILKRLFEEVGFQNAVRIVGFICLACCLTATVTVTARLPSSVENLPSICNYYKNSFRDVRFMFLVVGCCLISLGTVQVYLHPINSVLMIMKDFISPSSTLSTSPGLPYRAASYRHTSWR